MPDEVFLSHSSLDREFATSIAEAMRRQAIPVWYSQTNVVGAQQWHDEIGAALQRCDWFTIILSPNAVDSMWVRRELFYALGKNRFEGKIIPLLYQPCDYERLSWALSFFQMVDFTQDFNKGCAALMRVWGLGYRP